MSVALAGLVGATLLQGTGGVDYTITISEAGPDTRVEMQLAFAGDSDGETVLHLPDEWGGQGELWTLLQDLRVEGGELRAGETPAARILQHDPAAHLTVTYSIQPDRPGAPDAAAGDYYRPYVLPGYVHLIGNTVFAFPETETNRPVTVSVNTPEDWALASDLEHGALTRDTLMASVLVAGDFRVSQVEVAGAPVRLAMRGEIAIDDDAMLATLGEVVAANHAYWNTPGEPYLVTVLPLEAPMDWISVGGTNLGDSFAFFTTPNADSETLKRILMHEHVHSWNPRYLGGSLTGTDEPGGYWFSEGVTDFLTQRAAVRAGVWPPEQAIEAWNGAFADYQNSPVRDVPNTAIVDGFWTDPDLQRLPYLRGMMFAALIDHRIRQATDSERDIDDVLIAMRSRSSDHPAPLHFPDAVRDVTGLDITSLMTRYIENGEVVTLDADTFGACGPVITTDEPVFVYGMTGSGNADGDYVIDTVDPDGPAAPAGFEPGMVIEARLGGAVGDASTLSVLRVRTPDGEVRELSYWPTDGTMQSVTRIDMSAAAPDARACTARLAGTDAGNPPSPMP